METPKWFGLSVKMCQSGVDSGVLGYLNECVHSMGHCHTSNGASTWYLLVPKVTASIDNFWIRKSLHAYDGQYRMMTL